MENEKEGDVRVPLVFAVFSLCVVAGGVFLVIYVFLPALSKPWYPAAALLLIGAPWLFWLLTYFYTIIKHFCAARRSPATADHQVSRRPSTNAASQLPLTNSV